MEGIKQVEQVEQVNTIDTIYVVLSGGYMCFLLNWLFNTANRITLEQVAPFISCGKWQKFSKIL